MGRMEIIRIPRTQRNFEEDVKEYYIKQGYSVTHNSPHIDGNVGIPDFTVSKGEEIFFVEAKSWLDGTKRSQNEWINNHPEYNVKIVYPSTDSSYQIDRTWTKEDIETLKKVSPPNMYLPAKEVRNKYLPSRSEKAIYSKRAELGLSLLYKKICPRCNKEFETVQYNHIYCSPKCMERHRRKDPIKKNCLICNKEFITTRPFHKFCSLECVRIDERAKRKIREPRRIFDKICRYCGEKFKTDKHQQMFCKEACSYSYHKENRHDSLIKQPIPCKNCGKLFIPKSKVSLFCSKDCARKNKKHIFSIKICPRCKKEFLPHQHLQVFCSSKCGKETKKIPPKEKKCLECGKIFKGRQNKKFCSHFCTQRNLNKRHSEERKLSCKDIKRICPNCGREFILFAKEYTTAKYRNQLKRKYCSERCKQIALDGKGYEPKTQSMRTWLREKYPDISNEFYSMAFKGK